MSVPRMMPELKLQNIYSRVITSKIFYMKRDISNLPNVDSQNILDKSFIEHPTSTIGLNLINREPSFLKSKVCWKPREMLFSVFK